MLGYNGRVLAILTSKVLYGKERANITVYNILKNKCGKDIHVMANTSANDKLTSALSSFNVHRILMPSREKRPFRIFLYAGSFLAANIYLLWLIIRLRPESILMCNEIAFYDFYPSLYFFRKKILYRVGDAPAYEQLAFRKYNEHVWRSFVIKRVNRIVCNAIYVQNTVVLAGRNPINDRIIYNYPPARNIINKDETSLYSNIDKTKITFGYIGQVTQAKGVLHLINSSLKLLAEGRDIQIVIAGSLSYDKSFAEECINKIPAKFKSKIFFVGEIEDIDLYFSYIDVLCIPSIKQEPLANVLSEAKYHKIPSIVYPSGGLPELITNGVDGYVCKESTEKNLYTCMGFYIENESLIVEHGAKAFESIYIHGIDETSFTKKWIEAYSTMP